MASLIPRVARWGSHLVIWTVVLVPTVLEMVRGWRPLYSDDATITLRSYEILSLHPPLVGQYSSISPGSGHILFDPGPLQYVLLSVPTHIDHLQGGLWGSALAYGLVLSVAVEAMWSVRRWLACVLVALAVVDLAWTVPSVFGHQIWNPDFGLIFLSRRSSWRSRSRLARSGGGPSWCSRHRSQLRRSCSMPCLL